MALAHQPHRLVLTQQQIEHVHTLATPQAPKSLIDLFHISDHLMEVRACKAIVMIVQYRLEAHLCLIDQTLLI